VPLGGWCHASDQRFKGLEAACERRAGFKERVVDSKCDMNEISKKTSVLNDDLESATCHQVRTEVRDIQIFIRSSVERSRMCGTSGYARVLCIIFICSAPTEGSLETIRKELYPRARIEAIEVPNTSISITTILSYSYTRYLIISK